MTTITLSASNLSALITLTPPIIDFSINEVKMDCTNLYNLSTTIKDLIDDAVLQEQTTMNLSFQEGDIDLFLQYVSDLQDTEFTLSQISSFIIFTNQNNFNSTIFTNIYNGILTLPSAQSFEGQSINILFGYLTTPQKVNLVLNFLTTSSLNSLSINDYALLFTQIYFNRNTLSSIFNNSNYSLSDRITLISGARTNANFDAFSKLKIDDLGTYYIGKSINDTNLTNDIVYYYVNLTTGEKTINGLPPGVTTLTTVTTISKATIESLILGVIASNEYLLPTLYHCLYNNGITIT